MGLLDTLRQQLRSVISWDNPGPDVLFDRWTEDGDEIKNASKLIVGPGQGCVFVYEGKIRAVISQECLIDLATANIPFWTTITRAMQSFESEHKVGLYFFRQAAVLNQKWGTTSPIRYVDPVYRFPVELKTYGNYSFRITDPARFFSNVVAACVPFLVSDFRAVMSERLLQPLSTFLAQARHSCVEIDGHRSELAEGIEANLKPEFAQLGFELTDFRVEGVDFDDGTKRRIERIADLGAEAQAAAAVGLDYTRLQQVEALRDAARNEGGAAGAGVGLGAGLGLGQLMTGAAAAAIVPDDPAARLQRLKSLLDGGLITAEDFAAKKQEILSRL